MCPNSVGSIGFMDKLLIPSVFDKHYNNIIEVHCESCSKNSTNTMVVAVIAIKYENNKLCGYFLVTIDHKAIFNNKKKSFPHIAGLEICGILVANATMFSHLLPGFWCGSKHLLLP